MDFMSFVPAYRTIFARRESLESQREQEWLAKEADRKHREHVHELKHRRYTESSLWVPSRLRKNRRNSDASDSSDTDKTTTIRWAA
ncbi:hypothetical protein LPJ77_000643 [Coemansia sp. RSA 2523]|nr:hypothetical protein LPJ54_000020 [Coemansia sp. RSA 1824]KAJ1786485.1 hypothetical protein LPJ62_003774 [Coemansia sp. RSA 2167]KAJ1786861.1 hypothetical protein LPJ67_003400 [Coemansia sp. RSA 1938]KAJ1810752.1 hypothetical protein LPJ77_000643 [Coemansia sp. RSA 2523]KAJ2139283.1 hypothetical protein GGH17_000615 [Coemansia sp. RSA 788]KAJ2141830.1 hypothetical protein IW142_004638 [Coemansia sp. RSA 564]KAJ2168401.1 hypothetical protein GGH15_001413 [Coemansia sp. RSA 562]KAJ2171639.1